LVIYLEKAEMLSNKLGNFHCNLKKIVYAINFSTRVNIVDVNDEAPEFEVFDGCASITEFHPIGDLITIVKAHDKDDPSTPNGRMVFSIESGNNLGKFIFKCLKSLL